MRTAALITAIVALSGTMVAGCSTTSQTADGEDVQLGRYDQSLLSPVVSPV